MIRKGTKLKLWGKEEIYTVGEFSIEVGESGSYVSLLELISANGETAKEPLWMIEELIRDCYLYEPEKEAFVVRLMEARERQKQKEKLAAYIVANPAILDKLAHAIEHEDIVEDWQ